MKVFQVFSLLGEEILYKIDSIISSEVAPYVKFLKVLPTHIQDATILATSTETPQEYLINLKNSWHSHNSLALRIDHYLSLFYKGEVSFDSINFVKTLRILLKEAYDTEERKRIYSAGVKLLFDSNIPRLKNKYHLTQEEERILLTAWGKDFWSYRRGEHAKLLLSSKERSYQLIADNVLNKFHAGEKKLLNYRMQSNTDNLLKLNKKELLLVVKEYEEYEKKLSQLSTQGYYLVSERSDLQSIQGLIQYDNCDEYLFAYNLFGIPDLLFRKLLVEFLVRNNLLVLQPSVLFYKKDQIDHALEKWENRLMNQEKTKKSVTRSEPPVFLQTRPTTCGVACVLMVQGVTDQKVLSSKVEGELLKDLKIKGSRLVPGISLAWYLKQNGFSVKVFHQNSERFWEHLRNFDPDMLEVQELRYAQARKGGVIIDKKQEIDESLLKGQLNQGSLIICGIDLEGEVKHAVLLYKIEDGFAYFNDPLVGKKSLPVEDFLKTMSTSSGKWCIVVSKE